MPRRARPRLAGAPFHLIQRGHNRNQCFFRDQDYQRYLGDLAVLAIEHRVSIHAYVLMTNHVHLLATPQDEDGLSALMKPLGQSHAQYVNRNRARSGCLWGGRFRSCLVNTERYLLVCHRYIECNPVRAGMVRHPGAYRWSSHRGNAFGAPDPLLTPHPSIEALGHTLDERQAAYRDLFLEDLPPGVIQQIRTAANGGHALISAPRRRKPE